MTPKIKTIGELLYWAYANLAMAHAAITDKVVVYDKKHYFIRSRLYNGLIDGSMDIRSFFDDERLKMILPQSCCYCGSSEHLAADHIIPRKRGGKDIGENLIWACRSCNSSKSATDMLEWMQSKNIQPSVFLYRRYLKILINYCRDNDLINTTLENAQNSSFPFRLLAIPRGNLPLKGMKLWVADISSAKETERKKMNYRIANWNLERPLKKSKKLSLALEKIKEISPDICILTETSRLADLGEGYSVVHTEEYPNLPEDHWAAIWSKWHIKEEIPTFDKHRAVCALLSAPFGDVIVYATIIPYHNAGVISGGKYASSAGHRKYSAWQMHKENIILQSADWIKISADFDNIPLVVAGDFNQTRDNQKGGYGTKATRELLSMALDTCSLACVTDEDFGKNNKLNIDPKKGRIKRNVDHICVPKCWKDNLSLTIGAWDHFTDSGTYMTDHNGVYLEFPHIEPVK